MESIYKKINLSVNKMKVSSFKRLKEFELYLNRNYRQLKNNHNANSEEIREGDGSN